MTSDYTFEVGAGTLYLARWLAAAEKDVGRAEKEREVVKRKARLLHEAFPTLIKEDPSEDEVCAVIRGESPSDQARMFLIDLAFADPFAPYQLRFKAADLDAALGRIAILVGLGEDAVKKIRETQNQAAGAHRKIDLGKAALWGLGGAVVLAAGGWAFAPIVATYLGAAAGLSGAAATAHGLALLGGGTLAAGGFGMAGGMWIVTGLGATAGLAGGGGATMLMQLGAGAARAELIKLQVSFKEVLLGNQVELKKAQEVVKSLSQQKVDVEKTLEEERRLNDDNAQRIGQLEETLTAIERSLEWMKKQEADAHAAA